MLSRASFVALLVAMNPGQVHPPETYEQELAALVGHCQQMHEMQSAVNSGTKDLHNALDRTPDKKPRPEHRQAALKLAGQAEAILARASKAIDLTNKNAALAFPEVFQELREDVKRLQRRLEICDVGTDTLALGQDILDTLKEMIAALKSR